jgi:hypothetical protein
MHRLASYSGSWGLVREIHWFKKLIFKKRRRNAGDKALD